MHWHTQIYFTAANVKQKHPMQCYFRFVGYLHETLINYNFKIGRSSKFIIVFGISATTKPMPRVTKI